MIIQTYQSQAVLKILHADEIYRAKRSIAYAGEYAALMDILNLKCDCPIFGVVKGRKQNTSGKVSSAVKLTLDVPDKFIKITEFSVWADFLYAFKFTKPGNYKVLQPDCEEITQRDYNEIIAHLRTQKKLSCYHYPQVLLEKINPVWLKGHKHTFRKTTNNKNGEGFFNLFRK